MNTEQLARESAGKWCKSVETEGPPLQPDEFESLVNHVQSALEQATRTLRTMLEAKVSVACRQPTVVAGGEKWTVERLAKVAGLEYPPGIALTSCFKRIADTINKDKERLEGEVLQWKSFAETQEGIVKQLREGRGQ